VKEHAMSLLQVNHFEFNRGLHRSYKSQQPGQIDLVGSVRRPLRG